MQYLVNHDRELIYRSFDSMEDLLKHMPAVDRIKYHDQLEDFKAECGQT